MFRPDFPVIDVTAWQRLYPELRGNRPKCWIAGLDGKEWLRKGPRPSRPFELAIEVAMLRLALAARLPAPMAHLAVWDDPEVDGHLQRGIIVRNFLRSPPHLQRPKFDLQQGKVLIRWPSSPTELAPTGEPLANTVERFATGAEVLEGVRPDYDRTQHVMHTPERVYDALGIIEGTFKGWLRRQLVMLLLFDAWIGNGDRHQENWGLIFSTASQAPYLAHIYDPAACLGSELQGGHPLLGERIDPALLAKYIENCPTGFGDAHSLIHQPALIRVVRDWPETATVGAWLLDEFGRVRDTFVGALFEAIPDAWLPPWRKRLALALLRERLLWLKKAIS